MRDPSDISDGHAAIALVMGVASMSPEARARVREESRQRFLKAQEERKAYLAEHPNGRAAARRRKQMEKRK